MSTQQFLKNLQVFVNGSSPRDVTDDANLTPEQKNELAEQVSLLYGKI